MKKAYNVYKVYGKTNIQSLVKTFSFALVFGVCFLGLQTQSVAQSTPPDLDHQTDVSQDVDEVRASLDKNFSMAVEDAITTLRIEKRDIMNSPQPSDAEGEVERELNLMFLDIAFHKIYEGQSIQQGLLSAYSIVSGSRLYIDNKAVGVDLEDILETYADMLN